MTSKLEAALKNQENFLKKIKQYKLKEHKGVVDLESSNGSSKPSASKRRKEPVENQNEKQTAYVAVLTVDNSHCLVVAKGLLNLILMMDHSCSADIFLLSCKVSGDLFVNSKE